MARDETQPSRSLRVLTFLHSFAPGGVERVALRLHAAWVAQGIDARLVMGRDEGAMRHEWPGLAYDLLDSGNRTGPFETLWMIACLPGAIRRHRPDVLFCAGNSYTIVSVAMKLLLGRRCPPILAKISNDLQRPDLPRLAMPFYRLWLRIQGRRLDRIVAIAPAMAEEIAAMMQAPRTRIAVIDNPALSEAELDHLATMPRPRHDGAGRRFLAIGRLAPQKNFLGLVEAFARIARAHDTLTICGEGGQRAAIEARVERLGLAGRVRLPGHTFPLDGELARADALVLSSDYEGLPTVVLQAYAAGLPVVATDCSVSMPALLGEGRFGALVPPRDPHALARAMDAVLDRPFDLSAARAMARRFTVDLAARRYRQAMEDLIPSAALSRAPRIKFR
ncbi:glycosyltransferase [Novosphingobium huizhouense]|uniref:glycosyltransferase n=1 Tax=Novosphingobium huizhouense TaxID=2866625 RepID=UPI001CD90502|nr:glycosyltransferase [Novosphingobium huizhouense]